MRERRPATITDADVQRLVNLAVDQGFEARVVDPQATTRIAALLRGAPDDRAA